MAGAASSVQRLILRNVFGGVAVTSVPIFGWWYWSRKERSILEENVRTKVRVPSGANEGYDYLITEKCKVGDVVVMDRRCERCATSPLAALQCIISKQLLCDENSYLTVDDGKFEHIGIIVPGYVNNKQDMYDPLNLLILEATPNGIVAHRMKDRLERSASRTVLLLRLCCPGESRRKDNFEYDDADEYTSSNKIGAARARKYMERSLVHFRDSYIKSGEEKGYRWMHSIVGIGGAIMHGLKLNDILPAREGQCVSPAAFVVLLALQRAAVAENIRLKDNLRIKPEDFLRADRLQEKDCIRLRPGYKFMQPLALIETSSR